MDYVKSIKFFLCVVSMLSCVGSSEANPGRACAAGKQILWYFAEPTVDEKTYNGFTHQVFAELSAPVAALGYCLTMYEKKGTVPFSVLYRENMVMRIVCRPAREGQASREGKNRSELLVHLVNIKAFEKGDFETFPDRPLVSLAFAPEDIGSILVLFVKKIIENLRMEYICNLMISSEPTGVTVTAPSGLSDVTPLEWVVPVGTLDIQCNLKDYIAYKKEIIMTRPGVYNYFIQMKKRQFYHSKFFIPAIGFGVASAVCYGIENYYYLGKYETYGPDEKQRDPGIFERTFNTARTFERLAGSFLLVSCSFVGLSIWF
jgi:hypothetical protein